MKIFSWSPGLTYIILRLFGPESLGGKGDVRAKAEEEARLTGQSCGEVVMKVELRHCDGSAPVLNLPQTAFVPRDEVVRLPGMPPMYDYEYYPQDVSRRSLHVRLSSLIHTCSSSYPPTC